jgi:4-hydroxyproline epimerase
MSDFPPAVEVVDSHTEGEPTRVVVSGWPQPAGATMSERREALCRDQDHLRQAVVCEPRGHDAVVGALLTPPVESGSVAGVIFFNNAGALWMCGHGLIGVVRTLEYLGKIEPGRVRIDTPAGTVGAELGPADTGAVTIENVPANCHARDVVVEVPGLGRVTGDVSWGGNWFFLTELPALPGLDLDLANLAALTDATARIKRALADQGITGAGGLEIDHVEVYGPPRRPDADSRNFVLCPGFSYDRSPCGTGTSAKMAALVARGKLEPGERWRQESITGSLFTGWIERRGELLIPYVQGRAYITAWSTLFFDLDDPFRGGFTAAR